MKVPVKVLRITNICLLFLAFFYSLMNSNSSIQINKPLNRSGSQQAVEVRPGDILLLSENDVFDKLIQILTHSPYNHVIGVVNSCQGVDILPGTTVSYENLQNYIDQADIFTCDQLTEDDRNKIVLYITSKVGTSYDYNLLAWEASRYLFNRVWPYEGKGAYTCSTLWADAYREAGIDLCPGVKFPSPGDLANSKCLHKSLRSGG